MQTHTLPDYPDTYEKLVAKIAREHPTWSRADVERWIAAQQRGGGAR